MTRVTTLFASALVATFIFGCNAGPEDTVVPSEPAVSANVRSSRLSASQGATVFKFRAKGPSAQVFWEDGPLFGFLQVSLSQTQTGGKPERAAFIFYDISQCDAFICDSIELGGGQIPVEDVSASGNKRFSVHTDTSTIPDFFLLAGSGGRVDVDWSATDFFSTKSHSVEHAQFGDSKFHTSGSSSSVSATAMGSVIGSSVEGGVAEMGTSHDRFIQIIH